MKTDRSVKIGITVYRSAKSIAVSEGRIIKRVVEQAILDYCAKRKVESAS
jgi:hypothetical protein